MRRTILHNVASLGAVQALSLALPLLSLPYLTHVLGASGLGRVAFAMAAAQIVLVVSDYGFELTATRRASLSRDDPAVLTDLWCAVSALKLLLALLAIAGLMGFALVSSSVRSELPLIALACAMVAGSLAYPHWLFQGLERMPSVSVLQVAARLVCFAALFPMVHDEGDVHWAVFLQAAPLLLTGLLALPLTLAQLRRDRLAWPAIDRLKEELRDGRHVFWSAAAVNVYTASNTFLLGLLMPAHAVGQYHVAEKIIRAVQSLYGPVSHAVYPHVVRLAARSVPEALRFNRALMGLLALGSAVFAVGLFFMADALVRWLAGPQFAYSAILLQVLAWVPLLVAVSNVLGIQTMLPLGMERQFTRILVGCAALDLILFFPAVQAFGVMGAAWVNVAVELCVAVGMAITLHRAGHHLLGRPAALTDGKGL